ncbi:MAG TPA: GAF domain-containing protein, partial [Vicinamibacterales bacterium]|nr:GAF domain-containing protein [Vicinamibacterales bacterium]
DRFIEAQQQLSEVAETTVDEADAIDTIATKLRISKDVTTLTTAEPDNRQAVKALSILRSLKSSPTGISVEDLGAIVSRQLAKFAPPCLTAIYCITDNGQAIRCRYADAPLGELLLAPDIPLGERLSGWVAAHRAAIWNSDATLDLSTELAAAAEVTAGSSVPLVDGDQILGTLTLYTKLGVEISVEQRVLIQSILPFLVGAVSASLIHDDVAVIEAGSVQEREAIYTVMEGLLSGRGHRDRIASDRYVIIRATCHAGSERPEDNNSLLRTLERAIAAAANSAGYIVRLSEADVLIAAPQQHLLAMGLAPSTSPKSRRTDIQVTEIGNSLKLREALGLTAPPDPRSPTTRPLIH